MTGKDALVNSLKSTQWILNSFVSDLADSDLTVRPVPAANHIAWQIGHIIASETNLVREVIPGAEFPELPAALKDQMSGASAKSGGPTLTKAEYVDWFNKVREATVAAVAKLSDADLDKPNTGGLKDFAPTTGDLIILVSNHTLMHAGQFSVVRRVLGKPVLF